MTITRYEPGTFLSRAVEHNGTVYVCGVTAKDRSAGMKGQTEQVLATIDGYMALAGTDKTKLLSATCYVSDMSQKDGMNEAWIAWLDGNEPPARATVAVTLGTPDTLVEIMVVASK
jgi:enamine deaminase RidA (YjgF/YER057c/UK114 family)